MKRYLIANWKNYLSVEESVVLFKKLLVWEKKNSLSTDVELVVAPTLLALPFLAAELRGQKSAIKLAAQHTDFCERGAYTGMVAAVDLKKLGCSYVLVGHSERRQWLGENGKLLHDQMMAALRAGLKPIYCVGETKNERNKKQTEAVIKKQLKEVWTKSTAAARGQIIIAYEPRWAIGSGRPCSASEAAKINQQILNVVGKSVPILYGGSVEPTIVNTYLIEKNIAGVLVGGASAEFASLTALARVINKKV